MTLGTQIGLYRRKVNMTQEALAQKLGVTNQAVSKWESEQCCPDITLLPQIADIFGISLDELFGRPAPVALAPSFPEDDKLRLKLFWGGKMVTDREIREKVEVHWHGPALDVLCDCNLVCGEVQGNVNAGGTVNCDEVQGNVQAAGNVNCDDVQGNVRAGGNVTCDDVQGDVQAGGNVCCDCIQGGVNK